MSRRLITRRTSTLPNQISPISADYKYFGKNFTGMRFGKITVLGFWGVHKEWRRSLWTCYCDCGRIFVMMHPPNQTSCGCLRRANRIAAITTHGQTKTPLYRIWIAMRARCENPKCGNYPNYGARGIRFCERWRSFENFAADMGPRPTNARYTLERINNNGNYEPTNCRWATYKEQLRNRRNNRLMTFRGETHCVTEWAEILGISVGLIRSRLKYKWTDERALSCVDERRKKPA